MNEQRREPGWYWVYLGTTPTPDVVYADEAGVFHAGSLGSVRDFVTRWVCRIPSPDQLVAAEKDRERLRAVVTEAALDFVKLGAPQTAKYYHTAAIDAAKAQEGHDGE